jgi:hypothetical protein
LVDVGSNEEIGKHTHRNDRVFKRVMGESSVFLRDINRIDKTQKRSK